MSVIATSTRQSPLQSQRDQYIDAQMSTPAISGSNISGMLVESNATTKGVDVSFSVTNITGMASLSLVRASVMDIKQATVLQSWTASVSAFTWSDTDAVLQRTGQAYYWLKLEPSGTAGSEVVVGPQFVLLNPSLLPPLALTGISASHAAAVNGTVLVTCNVSGVSSSVKIYVTGYEGNASPVAVAQRAASPLQFTLQATGETITVKAIAVSSGGSESLTGPTCTLTLNGAATVPAKPQGVTVAQIAAGNQVMWPANLEAGVTGYQLWRGDRTLTFSAATNIATITASGAGTINYLDGAGLGGDYQYFVIAVATIGNSVPSDGANPRFLFSSAQLPPNASANTNNTAVLDSIDAGSSATLRIHGAGGLGTSYTRPVGYGIVTRISGSVTGLAYSTKYFVVYTSGTYLASTSYADSLPDGYEWVGAITTCPVGGGGSGSASASCLTSGVLPYGVTSVSPVSLGYGYGSASVTFSGGGGSGAAATANCSGGQVTSYTLTNPGSGYTGTPSVLIGLTSAYTGGGGSTGNGGARYVLAS